MTQEQIIENNKLIAEFMGWHDKIVDSLQGERVVRFYSQDETKSLSYMWDDFETELPYHMSWDWLMPVVEEIEGASLKTKYDDIYAFSFTIKNDYCLIMGHEPNRQSGCIYQSAYGVKPESKIKETYNAVIYFINWYNTQHQTNKT